MVLLPPSEVKWLSPVGATGPDDIDSGVSVVRYKAFCLGLGQTYSTGTNRKARPVSDDSHGYSTFNKMIVAIIHSKQITKCLHCHLIFLAFMTFRT